MNPLRQILRLFALVLLGIFLFTLPALGWLKLVEIVGDAIPQIKATLELQGIKMIGILWGLCFLLLPFHTLLIFHSSKSPEFLGFKPPCFPNKQ